MLAKLVAKFGAAIPVLLTASLFSGISAEARQAPKAKAEPKAAAPVQRIDLNSAPAEELATLPGVGEVTARKIVAGRPYKSLDDLARAGVPARTIDKIKPLVAIRPVEPVSPKERKAEADRKPATTASSAPVPSPAKRVDLNTADEAALATLPGVGEATAKKIIAARPYNSVDDLARVKGLGEAKIAAIRDHVKVGAQAPTPSPVPAPAPAPVSAAPKAESRPAAARTSAPAPRATPGAKVNLNTADKPALDALPGIGPVKAQAIIDARPFKSIDDVKRVKGIKDVEFGKIKDLITVN